MTSEPRRNSLLGHLSRRDLIKLAGGAGLAATGLAAFGLDGRGALAQGATPAAGGPPLPPGAKVVASGLLNPRYIAIADDGTLYVSEAGEGGNEPIFGPPLGNAGSEWRHAGGAKADRHARVHRQGLGDRAGRDGQDRRPGAPVVQRRGAGRSGRDRPCRQ